MVITQNNPSLFDKVSMTALIISPILETYGWVTFNFSFIIISLLSVANVFKRGLPFYRVPKALLVFLGFYYISHLIACTSIGGILHLGILRILLSILLLYSCFDIMWFTDSYRTIAKICIAFFFIQELSLLITGIRIPGVVSFLPNSLGVDVSLFIAKMKEAERSSSFFSEPAMFVQFLLPLLIVELFAFKNIKWRWCIFVVLTLLLTRSGNALIGLMLIAMVFIYWLFTSQVLSKKKKMWITTSVFLISIIAFPIYLNSEIGESMLERTDTMKLPDTTNAYTSGFLRIWRGYFVYDQYDTIYKIIGNDNPIYIDNAIYNSPVSDFFGEKERYFNNVQTCLLHTGIIGVFIFSFFIKKEFKHSNLCGKTLLLLFIVLSFIAYFYFKAMMLIILVYTSYMSDSTVLLDKRTKVCLHL